MFVTAMVASLTGAVVVAGAVENAAEQLESDDGVNNHDKDNEQSDVQQRNHCFENGIHHNLKTC